MPLSPYRMGWVIAMFDLPVMTDDERKAASRFRKDLLDHGYFMVQFSVYARPCVTYELLEKHTEEVKRFTPAAGNVRLVFISDQQWAKSVTVTGPNYNQGKRKLDAKMPAQVEFWE
jgi:CRISPR-associated protein Cas2